MKKIITIITTFIAIYCATQRNIVVSVQDLKLLKRLYKSSLLTMPTICWLVTMTIHSFIVAIPTLVFIAPAFGLLLTAPIALECNRRIYVMEKERRKYRRRR